MSVHIEPTRLEKIAWYKQQLSRSAVDTFHSVEPRGRAGARRDEKKEVERCAVRIEERLPRVGDPRILHTKIGQNNSAKSE